MPYKFVKHHIRVLPGLFVGLQTYLRTVTLLCLLIIPSQSQSADNKQPPLRDLFYGAALFHAYQGDYFSAISRLDTELMQHYALDDSKKDSLSYHRDEAELLIGDYELSYRMHRKVGRAMERLLKESLHESIRNQAAYRLAKIGFKKSSYENVLSILDNIAKSAPKPLKAKSALLRGQALLALGRYDEAIDVLKPIRSDAAVKGYAPYNLGIAQIENGDTLAGYKQLDYVGGLKVDNREMSALRDKANLALGFALMKSEQAKQARPFLERVHIKGPFSNKALLWVGWSDAANGRYQQALVPWMILRKRDITDIAVQESLLAAPYGYGQLNVHGKAAVLYGEAVETFEKEIGRLDASVKSIREGTFLRAMLSAEAGKDKGWLLRMRELPDAPETRYLQDLMTSHMFYESYTNYRELEDLHGKIETAEQLIPRYRKLIETRRRYYAPLLLRVDSAYTRHEKHLNNILAERDRIASQLKVLLYKRDPMAMASSAEREFQRRLDRLKVALNKKPPQTGLDWVKANYRRVQGHLSWRLLTEYDARMSRAHHRLKLLDRAIIATQTQLATLRRAKAEAMLSYQGFDALLQDLLTRLDYLKARIDGVMQHQGQFMERGAVSELIRRKKRLERYRTKARFALAESYDRATRSKDTPGAEK